MDDPYKYDELNSFCKKNKVLNFFCQFRMREDELVQNYLLQNPAFVFLETMLLEEFCPKKTKLVLSFLIVHYFNLDQSKYNLFTKLIG